MANMPAPVLTLAARHDGSSAEPLARAAALGRSVTEVARLFEALTAGDDFGGLDEVTETLARSRDAGHPTADALGAMVAALLGALSPADRQMLALLDAAWSMRAACAAEVGFHAGVAAGRAR